MLKFVVSILIIASLAKMPTDAKQCASSNFIEGLKSNLESNYQLIHKELRKGGCECNFDNVEKALQKISVQIKKVIAILSACDPTEQTLNDAIDRYDQTKKEYLTAIRRATASQSSDCGKLLAKIRPIPLNSAENIMAAVLKCINLKSA